MPNSRIDQAITNARNADDIRDPATWAAAVQQLEQQFCRLSPAEKQAFAAQAQGEDIGAGKIAAKGSSCTLDQYTHVPNSTGAATEI